MTTKSPVLVGVLLQDQIQLLDAAAVDLLGMLTPDFLRAARLSEDVVQRIGVNFKFLYIGERTPRAGLLTADARFTITHSPEEVHHLDILVIPGPRIDYQPTPVVKAFIQKCNADPATTVLTICTGAIASARSGIFTGRTVTAPAFLIPELKQEFPDVNWLIKRWVKDGRIKPAGGQLWSSGVILNGMDLIVAFITDNYGEESAKTVCNIANFSVRGQEFPGDSEEA